MKRVQSILNRVLMGCWFGHANIIRERAAEGELLGVCERCGQHWVWFH